MTRFCHHCPDLVGPHNWLPPEPFEFGWATAVGCNNLTCERCGEPVHARVPANAEHRHYACGCQQQEDMLERMYETAGRDRVDSACADLVRDPALLESAALIVLSDAWADESEQDRLRAVLTETKDKLPVVEVAIIAIMCMYGMYLWATGGKKKSEERTVERPDGSFEHTVKVEWHDPTGPLSALVRLFRRG